MQPIAPLQGMEDVVVDANTHGDADDSQGGGGDHGDDAKLEQGQQTHHDSC